MDMDSTTNKQPNIIQRGASAISGVFNAVKTAYKENEQKRKEAERKKASAYFSQRSPWMRNMWVFNGEKSLGGLGPPKDYLLDHASLRSRGNQFYMDNEVVQIIINRMADWAIGNGLRLECEPNELVLKSEGITLNVQEFSDLVEARINTLAESKETDYNHEQRLVLSLYYRELFTLIP